MYLSCKGDRAICPSRPLEAEPAIPRMEAAVEFIAEMLAPEPTILVCKKS